jgi:hypothetical protein
MRMVKTMIALGSAGLLSTLCNVAHADGLADLKTALARLNGHTPVKGVLESKTWSKQGSGKDAEERSGQASVAIDDSARGLQMLYTRELLSKAEAEELAREKDKKIQTPTLSAMREISSGELRPMIFAARTLSRSVEKGVFKSEKAEAYAGKPARLLTFDIPVESMSEKEREYIKKFESTLSVWVAADGTPLASRVVQNVSGRAFIVVTFESSNDEQNVYAQVGDRLVSIRKETKNNGAGMGEKGESKSVKTLQLQT